MYHVSLHPPSRMRGARAFADSPDSHTSRTWHYMRRSRSFLGLSVLHALAIKDTTVMIDLLEVLSEGRLNTVSVLV